MALKLKALLMTQVKRYFATHMFHVAYSLNESVLMSTLRGIIALR